MFGNKFVEGVDKQRYTEKAKKSNKSQFSVLGKRPEGQNRYQSGEGGGNIYSLLLGVRVCGERVSGSVEARETEKENEKVNETR